MSKEQAAEKLKQLQTLKNSINRKGKGRPLLVSADEAPNTFTLRRPCGIAQLDLDTGGGLPAGGLSYISGPDNAGKTLLLWKYFAMQQRLYGKDCMLAYVATESAPDLFFARKCGVRVAIPDVMIEERVEALKQQGAPPMTKEELKELKTQVGHIEIARGDSGEEILGLVLDLYASKLFSIAALDSVSVLLPENELDRELTENGQQGSQASLLGKFAKRFYPMVTGLSDTNFTTLIFTAQVRANRKKSEMASYIAKYVDDYATVGSYEMRHVKLLDILVSSGSYEKEKDAKGGKHVTGKTLRWKIQKGKAGTHDGIAGETDLVYDSLASDSRSLILAAMRYGLVKETTQGISTTEASGLVMEAGQKLSMEEFIDMLDADFSAQLKLKHRINAAAGITCLYAAK